MRTHRPTYRTSALASTPATKVGNSHDRTWGILTIVDSGPCVLPGAHDRPPISAAAAWLDAHGLLVPSARSEAINLVIFPLEPPARLHARGR